MDDRENEQETPRFSLMQKASVFAPAALGLTGVEIFLHAPPPLEFAFLAGAVFLAHKSPEIYASMREHLPALPERAAPDPHKTDWTITDRLLGKHMQGSSQVNSQQRDVSRRVVNREPRTEEIEIDPEILSMIQHGSLESAVSLLERARLANVEEETGVPSFRKLLEDGVIQKLAKKGQMLLGYVDDVPRYGTWLDLYSTGIGGSSGSGKSTTVRFLLFQMILAGSHLIMIDPHINEEQESLAAEFRAFTKNVHLLPPCDDNEQEVMKRVKFLMAEFQMRKAKGIKGPPIVFVLDEYNALVRSLSETGIKALADLLLAITQEARKFGIFAMIIAQRWSEQDLGGKNYGAAIRSSLSSRIGHRFTDEDQAKRFMGTRYGPKLLEIKKGHYFFRDTEGGIKETVTPYTVSADGEVIRTMLFSTPKSTSRSTSEALLAASEIEPEVDEEVDPEADTEELDEVPVSEDFKVRRVREMLREKKSQNEIIMAVWQASGGKKYQEAAVELREIIAGLI